MQATFKLRMSTAVFRRQSLLWANRKAYHCQYTRKLSWFLSRFPPPSFIEQIFPAEQCVCVLWSISKYSFALLLKRENEGVPFKIWLSCLLDALFIFRGCDWTDMTRHSFYRNTMLWHERLFQLLRWYLCNANECLFWSCNSIGMFFPQLRRRKFCHNRFSLPLVEVSQFVDVRKFIIATCITAQNYGYTTNFYTNSIFDAFVNMSACY